MKKILLNILSIYLIICYIFCGLVACGDNEYNNNYGSDVTQKRITDNIDDHEHSFTQKVVSADYLKEKATCKHKAIYYYSCSCGKAGTQTFESGEFGEHTYDQEWSYNETYHYHMANCGHNLKADVENHTFNSQNKCTKCGFSKQNDSGDNNNSGNNNGSNQGGSTLTNRQKWESDDVLKNIPYPDVGTRSSFVQNQGGVFYGVSKSQVQSYLSKLRSKGASTSVTNDTNYVYTANAYLNGYTINIGWTNTGSEAMMSVLVS